jgi:hypothetical protein
MADSQTEDRKLGININRKLVLCGLWAASLEKKSREMR